MSLFDKKPSLMPVVIAPDVWQSAVDFPPTRSRWKNGWAICCSPYC
ncbi:hypothetical protein [Enterobacter cloacae]|nr:hypothetical protein [Enterobacter cloacae]